MNIDDHGGLHRGGRRSYNPFVHETIDYFRIDIFLEPLLGISCKVSLWLKLVGFLCDSAGLNPDTRLTEPSDCERIKNARLNVLEPMASMATRLLANRKITEAERPVLGIMWIATY